MPVHQDHKDHAPASVKCGIATRSDRSTKATDDSGKLIRELLLKAGHKVLFYMVVKDEAKAIADAVEQASWTCDAVITNGGTGLSRRDVTIPTLASLFERTLPGFGEIFRRLSYDQIGSASMLSGAMAGVCHGRLVFCLPGFPGGLPPGDGEAHPARTQPCGGGDGQVRPARHADRHDHDERAHHGRGMRPLRALVSLDDALRTLDALARPIERRDGVPLREALHRHGVGRPRQ